MSHRRLAFLTALSLSIAACAALPSADPPATPDTERVWAAPSAEQHLTFQAVKGSIEVYDMDHGFTLVRTIAVPGLSSPRGIAANASTDRLYVAYWGDRDDPKYGARAGHFGYLTALDLRTSAVLWTKTLEPSIDSFAITPDGSRLYMPSGEEMSTDYWSVLDADGTELTRIPMHAGTHNTIVSLDGSRAYLTSLHHDQLAVVETSTNTITRWVGPFRNSIRPFAVNGMGTLALVNVDGLSGFEVASLVTGERLFTVRVEGFPWTDPPLPETQSHGVAFSPDEREAWVVDAANRRVHVFDVSGLPAVAPRQVASVSVVDPSDAGNRPKWVNFSRDGRFVHVSTGDIVDARSRTVVARVAQSRYFVEVDFNGGAPVFAWSRYGVGYVVERPVSR